MSKKMSNLTKSKISNTQHLRLIRLKERKSIWAKSNKEADGLFEQTAYHKNVIRTQRRIGRVLSKKEKEYVFGETVKSNYNPNIEFLNIK